MRGVGTVVRYGLEEALRRKVFVVVLLLTVAFLGLYALGNHYAFASLSGVQPPAARCTSCPGTRPSPSS